LMGKTQWHQTDVGSAPTDGTMTRMSSYSKTNATLWSIAFNTGLARDLHYSPPQLPRDSSRNKRASKPNTVTFALFQGISGLHARRCGGRMSLWSQVSKIVKESQGSRQGKRWSIEDATEAERIWRTCWLQNRGGTCSWRISNSLGLQRVHTTRPE
jgi:hypothetical protein